MTFSDAVRTCFEKYADFSGRARRSEYWFFFLFTSLVSLAISLGGDISASLFGDGQSRTSVILATVFELGMIVPELAVTWRRFHDIGKSGGAYFLGLIPLVGPILVLIFLCRNSEPGENRFGPNPKEVPSVRTVNPLAEPAAAEPVKPAAEPPKKAESAKSFCPKCGQQVAPEDNFCINCGWKLK